VIYLLLFAGLFMGWSLGTVDSASAFSTAVATRVVKYRTAVIIIAIFVVVGAFISGQTNITRVAELAISNDVLFSPEDVKAAIEDNTVALLQTKAALKAAIIYASAGLTVFIMSYLKFPVSSNQSITGAIIGWGLFYADYSNPEILNLNLTQIGRFALTWLLNPLCACGISFGLVWLIAGGGGNSFSASEGDCVKNGDKVAKVSCSDAGAYQVKQVVDAKEQCADKNQPYIVADKKVYCLVKPAG
jgi:phosphate/sulfate permease